MSDIVFWSGPVAPFQVPGATVPGATDVFIGCLGDRSPLCPNVGEQLRNNPQMLLDKAHASSFGDLFLGAFSAGGSVVKRMLEEPEWRDRVTAVQLADATWTSGVKAAPAIEGMVRYGVDVANGPGDKLFIASASPIANKQWATGHQNLDAIQHAIEARTGRSFEASSLSIPGIEGLDHAQVSKLGNVIFIKMPLEPYGHGHTEFAPLIWQDIIQPWVAKGKGPIESPGGIAQPPGPVPPVEPPAPMPVGGWSLREGLAFVGGFAAGSLAVWWATS